MIKHRTEIDGLRTIAVIPVILFHLGYDFAKGGFYGVDVFFVISGYLITKILIDDMENKRFSMYNFLLRRVRRLLPSLLTIVIVTLIITPFLVFKPVIKEISQDVFPAIFSYFNFHALYDFGDYWGEKAEQSFFLHTWSLSIEEQFYLFYPIFLFFSYKYFKNIGIPILAITLASVFLFFFYAKVNEDVDTAFYMFPTRIWEFSIGALCGIVKFQNYTSLRTQKLLPIAGIVIIIFSYLIGNRALWILPVFGSSLIIAFCTPNDIVGKTLSTKLFVFIGKTSYSIYLWHWVLVILFKNLSYQFQNINPHIVNGLILSLTILFGYLSYTFIENKTRNNRHTPKIVLAGISVIVALTFYFQSDFYTPYYKSKYNTQIVYFSYYDINPEVSIPDTNSAFSYNVTRHLRLPKFNLAYKKDGIITNKKNGTPKIILIGDSHGVMWAKLLNEISDELNVTISCYTSNGNSSFFNLSNLNSQDKTKSFSKTQRADYAKSIVQNIEKWKPKIVVLANRWENSIKDRRFLEMMAFLEKRNIKVLLLNQPPVLTFMGDQKNPSQYITYLGLHPIKGYNLIQVNLRGVDNANNELRNLSAKYRNAAIYDVYKNMLIKNKVKISLNKDVLYYDDDHLNYKGTFLHKENISLIIKNLINTDENNCLH